MVDRPKSAILTKLFLTSTKRFSGFKSLHEVRCDDDLDEMISDGLDENDEGLESPVNDHVAVTVVHTRYDLLKKTTGCIFGQLMDSVSSMISELTLPLLTMYSKSSPPDTYSIIIKMSVGVSMTSYLYESIEMDGNRVISQSDDVWVTKQFHVCDFSLDL